MTSGRRPAETLAGVRRRSLASRGARRRRRPLGGRLAGLRPNFQTAVVAGVVRRGRPGERHANANANAAALLRVRVPARHIAHVIAAPLGRAPEPEELGAPVARRHAPLARPAVDAAVLTRRGLGGRLGHQKAPGLMGNGVKQEVAFAHQRPLTGQRREVRRRLPARRGVRQEALHAERVAFQRGGAGAGARAPGAAAVRAARRGGEALRVPRRSLVVPQDAVVERRPL
ncbi:hypothetical protein EYF80_052489 [Liparis tanakae]|uniref:Uncharacterized protein n=1 Tax=Liparis tanakae TaxID=230148 RepID=A0A4Z2F888_9TELE|nr:hypothetical protein EYF80_052489 [Liparis tanakae]